MKKKIFLFQILYYILFLLCYAGVLYAAALLLKTNDLAKAVVRAVALLFVFTPLFIAVFTRFSLLKWYVDPIAAAIVPSLFYFGLVFNELKARDSLGEAFATVNWALTNDSATGWLFLIGLFIFGLLVSISPARREGRSVSYRLLDKITAK